MNKVRRKFVLYAMISVFALLTVLLSIINGINFTMASSDADMITQIIADRNGSFQSRSSSKLKEARKTESPDSPGSRSNSNSPGSSASSTGRYGEPERMGPMGPSSPEIDFSVRYFTFAFDKNDNAETIAFEISAVEEEEALEWAEGLKNESVGWTKGTYRYRVYTEGKRTVVTVIDQGRELLPSYRILIISVCGEALGLALSFVVLRLVGKKLFKPLEEADGKQKKFLSNIENEFKIPLTIINANTEIIEKENGSSEYTKSINRQVKKMTALVKEIGSLVIFDKSNIKITKVNLSDTFNAVLDYYRSKFEEKGIELNSEIEGDIIIEGEEESAKKVFSELLENSLKYSKKKSAFSMRKEGDRIFISQKNDTELSQGSIDQIFDRFTILENAEGTDSVGLGLSYVKDIVKAHNGRVSAKVTDNTFVLQIAL